MNGIIQTARMGRHGDTELAHVNPHEAQMLKKMGGSGTINPKTGLREFFPLEPITDGELKLDPTGAYYTPKGGMTVEDRMTGLLAKDNPYMQAARAGAAKTANSRGLLNSSIAASAGEEAAIKSALPIAQQDAAYYQNLGQQKNQGAITSILQGEEGDIRSILQGEEGDIRSRQQAEQGVIQAGLYETQGDISGRLQAEQGALNSQLSAQQAAQETALKAAGYTHETYLQEVDQAWKSMDLDARMQVEANRLSQENKAMFDTSTKAIADDYAKDFLAILVDPAFSQAGRTAALNSLKINTQSRYDLAAQIAGFTLTWTPTTVSGVI